MDQLACAAVAHFTKMLRYICYGGTGHFPIFTAGMSKRQLSYVRQFSLFIIMFNTLPQKKKKKKPNFHQKNLKQKSHSQQNLERPTFKLHVPLRTTFIRPVQNTNYNKYP